MELAWLQKCTPDYLKLSEVSTIRTFSSRKWQGFAFSSALCWESSEVITSIYRINVRFRLCLLELYHLGRHVRHLANAWLLIVANVVYLLVNYVGIICPRTLVISMSIVVPHSTVGAITFLATSLIITCTDQDQPLSSQ